MSEAKSILPVATDRQVLVVDGDAGTAATVLDSKARPTCLAADPWVSEQVPADCSRRFF